MPRMDERALWKGIRVIVDPPIHHRRLHPESCGAVRESPSARASLCPIPCRAVVSHPTVMADPRAAFVDPREVHVETRVSQPEAPDLHG